MGHQGHALPPSSSLQPRGSRRSCRHKGGKWCREWVPWRGPWWRPWYGPCGGDLGGHGGHSPALMGRDTSIALGGAPVAGAAAARPGGCHRWCAVADATFGPELTEAVGAVVARPGGACQLLRAFIWFRLMSTHICLAHQRSVGVFAFSAAGPATSSASVAPVLAGAASASGASESLASTKQLTPSSSVVPSSVLSSGDASSTVSASAAAWAAAQSASAAATAITRASGCGLRIARTCRCGRRGGTLSAGWQ
jgi:hypothetical protein